jgi:hypothetical protein
VREPDERFEVSDVIAQRVTGPRGNHTPFPLAYLVRQSVYRRLAGHEDLNDGQRLSGESYVSPAVCILNARWKLRLVVSVER